MTSHHVDLRLTVLLDSPLHIGVGYGHAGFLDAVMTTDAQGHPYIPGSSLKGRLRYYMAQIQPVLAPEEQMVTTLFGSKEEAGHLVFDNCALTPEWAELVQDSLKSDLRTALARTHAQVVSQRQTNVMLSRLRGIALERRLFSAESAPAHLSFRGHIHGQVNGDTTKAGYPVHLCLLVAAIRACAHLGGRKSRGLGRCKVEIDDLVLDAQKVDPLHLLEALA